MSVQDFATARSSYSASRNIDLYDGRLRIFIKYINRTDIGGTVLSAIVAARRMESLWLGYSLITECRL